MKSVANMELVASMELVEPCRKHPPLSVIYEVASMQKSFGIMVDNLEEYRAFMPQAILQKAVLAKLCVYFKSLLKSPTAYARQWGWEQPERQANLAALPTISNRSRRRQGG